MEIHVLTPEQSRCVDQAASDRLGIHGLVLMENAARGVTNVVLSRWGDRQRILVICGSGNNGGDGYAVARQLLIRGRRVDVLALHAPREGSDAASNRSILERMGQPILTIDDLARVAPNAELIIDAIFGTGLDRDVTGDPAHAIAVMNECGAPILAVDIPSGLDATRGRPLGIAAVAEATVTFVGPKPGLLAASAAATVGDLYVSDIGAPMELAAEFGIPLRVFNETHGSTDSTPEFISVDECGVGGASSPADAALESP